MANQQRIRVWCGGKTFMSIVLGVLAEPVANADSHSSLTQQFLGCGSTKLPEAPFLRFEIKNPELLLVLGHGDEPVIGDPLSAAEAD